MSQPRRILANTTYIITRRCILRMFLLRPDPVITHAIMYCLAVAASRFDIQLHAFCFLSNHYHLVLTDPHRLLPKFMEYFNRLVAKCVNAYRNRSECVWSPGSYNAVALSQHDGPLEKVVYTLANPVAAGLVQRASDWPGLWSSVDSFGTTVTVKRPAVFFRDDGTMPEEASLTLCRPPSEGEPNMTDDEWKETVRNALQQKEESIREEFRAEGRSFLGVRKVLSVSPDDAPRRQESQEDGNGIRPRVAEHTPSLRQAALKLLREFVSAYNKAFTAFRNGIRDVVFPAGTYKMRVCYAVCCEPDPLPT